MPFQFYPGQLEYLARVATKDCALVAADTGCSKSLMALVLIQLKLGTFDDLPTVVPVPPTGDSNSSRQLGQSTRNRQNCNRQHLLQCVSTVKGTLVAGLSSRCSN